MRLGLTAIIRDRAPWIREWIAFHHLVGFRKFYIYTHRCKDRTTEICKSLKGHFDINVFVVDENTDRPQYVIYNHAYEEFCHEVDWMAFIDGDEFLFATNGEPLAAVLERYFYEKLSAIAVHWACFGSSGHVTEPTGLIIENFRHRGENSMPANRHVKSIVLGRQGRLVQSTNDPHVFATPRGTFDERMRPVLSGKSIHFPSYEFLRINHYVTQSRQYFDEHKRGVGLATHQAKSDRARPESWWVEHDRNDVRDDSLGAYIAPVKELLATLPGDVPT